MITKAQETSNIRVILAGLVGNVIEWYDFALYGYFANVIGQQCFPSSNPSVSLIAAEISPLDKDSVAFSLLRSLNTFFFKAI